MKYTAQHFHLHYIPKYRLLIRSDFLEDTMMVVDENQEVVAFYSYPSEFPDPAALKLLGLPFADVSISLPLESFTLVPSEVYSQRQVRQYHDFQEGKGIVQEYALSMEGITALYQYDHLLFKRWTAIFPQAKLFADFQIILALVQQHVLNTASVLGVHVKNKKVEIYVFQGGKLQLYHDFDVDTADDLHYFILNVRSTLGIMDLFDKVLLSGVAATDPFAHAVRSYAHELVFLQGTSALYAEDAAVQTKIESLHIIAEFPSCVS